MSISSPIPVGFDHPRSYFISPHYTQRMVDLLIPYIYGDRF